MYFLIENKSTVVTDAQIATMCVALNRALIIFCAGWGWTLAKCAPCDAINSQDPLAVRVVVIDDDPERQGELGDHSEDSGIPIAVILAKVVTDAGGGVLDGGSVGVSVASVIAHEVFETLCDLNVNDWIFDGKNFLAKEVSDPVEGAPNYAVQLDDGTSVELSNAVFPPYFDLQAPEGSTFDLCGACKIPLELLPGGYQVVFDVKTGQETQVFGASRLELHEKIRAHRFSRRARRARAVERARKGKS